MNLTELKQKPIAELLKTAQEMGLDNVSRSRKQDIIFVILKNMPRMAKTFMEMVYWKYCKMVLGF